MKGCQGWQPFFFDYGCSQSTSEKIKKSFLCNGVIFLSSCTLKLEWGIKHI